MRSLLHVGLRPLRGSRISFGIQLVLVLFWLVYALMLIFSDTSQTNDYNYFYYVFLGLALVYLLYLLAQNTSLFGSQSYLEITPAYVVQKEGHFRKKMVVAFEDLQKIEIMSHAIRLVTLEQETYHIDLKKIRKRRDVERVKALIREMAVNHNVPLFEGPLTK